MSFASTLFYFAFVVLMRLSTPVIELLSYVVKGPSVYFSLSRTDSKMIESAYYETFGGILLRLLKLEDLFNLILLLPTVL